MRLRPDALLLAVLVASSAAAEQPASVPNYQPITREEIGSAIAKLHADPNLGGEKKIKSLHWVPSSSDSQPPKIAPDKPASWIVGLVQFISESASLLMWILGAIAAAVAIIWIVRLVRLHTPAPSNTPAPRVERIAGMDIRPDSLPEDIGAAALALLESGRTRDALSLLYRGALSRAVHRYGVPIDESFTEGEALKAVNARLDGARTAYFSDVVGVWQRAVYAGEAVARETVARLCRGFVPALDGAPA